MSPTFAAFPRELEEGALPPILVLTRDRALADVLHRLAVAAGAELDVREQPPSVGRWARPGLVIVGADLAQEICGSLPRRSDLLVVGRAEPVSGDGGRAAGRRSGGGLVDESVWRAAVELGARRVAVLPAEQDRVLDALSDALDGGPRARVVAVVPASGGAGGSVFAAALGAVAAARGVPTLLVDLDPLGGGIDLLVGADRLDGLRWPGLSEARGRVGGDVLREALPRLDSLSVLSFDRSEPAAIPAEAGSAVADGARRGFDLLVLDLPRVVDLVPPVWLRAVDVGVVVARGNLRSAAAGVEVVAALDPLVSDLRAVVRAGPNAGLPAELVADGLGLPLLGELRPEPGLGADLHRGDPPGLRGRGPLARLSGRLLDGLPGLGAAA